MPSDYPADLDALPLPDFDGALGQPARPASGVITDITDSIKAIQTAIGTTTAPGPILVQSGVTLFASSFGMVPGVLDDDAFQDALDAAASVDGATLYFGPGEWLVGAARTIPACDGLTLDLGGGIIKAHSSKSLTSELLKTDSTGAPARLVGGLTIKNGVFDGASLAPEMWLQNPLTGAAITDPEADYYDAGTNPSGKIGNPSFPTYDVMDLITDNRRNPDLDDQAPMLRLTLTAFTRIENVVFRNHYGFAVTEAGGKNVAIEGCLFHDVGKSDGPYQAIWTQSHGDPTAPTGTYQDSENINILNCVFRDLQRGAMIFAPTKGGRVMGCTITNTLELGIFCPDNLCLNGGRAEIAYNTIIKVRISDIVSNGIELGLVRDLWIHHNHIEDTDGAAVHMTGAIRTVVENNTTLNCYRTHTIAYGPFSERYSFNIGDPPIAGESRPVADGRVFAIGTLAGTGCKNVAIRGNVTRETRGSFPSVFQQIKSGGNNLAGLTVIEDNILDVPSGMTFLDTSIGTMWLPEMPLHIRNNTGHASEAPVVYEYQFASAETGAHTVTVGFRPRTVHLYAAANTATLGMSCVGILSWKADGTAPFFSERFTFSDGTTAGATAINATQIARLVDAANVPTFTATFTAPTGWKETGFTFTVGVCSQTTNFRAVCIP